MQLSIINKRNVLMLFLVASFLLNPIQLFGQNSVSINSKGKSKIHFSNNKTDFKIEYEGEITLTDDDKDIKHVSRGGYIEIKKSSFGKRRRIIIENDGGKLTRKYFIGWSEKNYYPDGKRWLEDILPEILRSTTIGAKGRVERFYKNGGANAVLDEIKMIKSDYVKSAYFKLLLEKNLSTSDLVSTIESAGNNINSDHYLTQILKKNQKAFLKNEKTIDAYIKASRSINSDHYLTQVVKAVIGDREITDNQLGSLLKVSESINSDHYLTQVLREIMSKRELNSQNMEKIMSLSKSINSDHYKTLVLKRAIRNKNLSKAAYNSFINSLSDINSDHYTAEVIKELMAERLDAESLDKVLDIIKRNVSSSHYATVIYKKLAQKRNLSEAQLISILNAAESISSSHYLSQTLLAFAPQVRNSSKKVKDVYAKVAKSINSDTYFGRAMKAIY